MAERPRARGRGGQAAAAGKTLGEMGLDRFAPYLMNRVMGRWNATVAEIVRAHGLTTAQMRALAVLSVRPSPTVHELAVFTVTEPSTMSRTLDALEDKGLVARGSRPDDGRARQIALTAAGAAAFAEIWPAMLAAHETMFAGIDAEERDAFLATLTRVLVNVRRHPL